MAEPANTTPLPDPQCESTPEHPDDAPAPLFGRGEVDYLVRINEEHRQASDFSEAAIAAAQAAAEDLARGRCTSLDGIAAKLEWVLSQQLACIDLAERADATTGWRLIEALAVATSALDLHRIIRCHQEG